MRFEKLFLHAFGPFTDEKLDLSGGAPGGLHVIYGPNEAGKSTSLRAVTGFLFGIPHITGDAHLHPSNRLSVGAELSADGRIYSLSRLKRRKDSLVDGQGEPLVRNPLPGLLANLDERSFTSRFGLDQVDLERGAEALLGGSEQGLFAAGTAGAEVRRVLDELDQRSGELYRARGSKPLLNRALAEYEQAAREARRAERPPEKWLEQKRAHEEAKARVLDLRTRRHEVRAELRRLNRLRGLMSDLTAWEEGKARRGELGDEPPLPGDASQVRQESERVLGETAVERRHLQKEIDNFERELAGLPPDSPLAEVDDEQLQLSARAGTAISARKDLPKRQASLLEQERQIRELFSDLGRKAEVGRELELARQIIPSARTAAQVRGLLAEHGAILTAAEVAEKSVRRAEREVSRLEESDGPGVPSVEALAELEAVHADAQADQGLATTLLEDEQEQSRLEGQVGRLRAQLGAVGAWRELAPLVPSADRFAAAVGRYRELVKRFEEAEIQVQVQTEQLQTLRARQLEAVAADLPTEDKLKASRRERDEAVKVLVDSPDKAQLGQVRTAIEHADELSDRLRHEADRVASAAALAREVQSAQSSLDDLRQGSADALKQLNASREAHKELCKKIGLENPGEPDDAVSVFEALRTLVDVEARHEELGAAMAAREERVATHREQLCRVMARAPSDAGFSALLVAAARELRQGLAARERAKQRSDALSRAHLTLEEAIGERARTSHELEAWEERWAGALAPLGLPGETSISIAQDALTTFEKMVRVLQEAANLERRIAGMERDTQSLAEDVRAVLKRYLPELLEMDPVDAAVQLQEAIRSARRVREERRRYRELVEDRRATLAKVESREATADSRLESLVRAAGVESRAELPAAEERLREIRSLETKLDGLERAIREKADGASLDELRGEAAEWKGRAAQLNQEVYELEERSEELEEQFRAAESDEAGMKLGLDVYRTEDVAKARQHASMLASEARARLREYLVTKTAHTLLKQQMETYAERFAGPIAGRAGELFERMTLGRYTKLSIGIGERTLRCVREGQELEVTQLSRGTRAQLYFALRLASLENYFAEQPTIPLVFDDLFVDFDDNRTTAAFEILAELAEKVQVLYFTHLARDVEAAQDAVSSKLLFEHRLGVA